MVAVKLTSKGRVTLPKEVRDALGVAPGDEVAFRRTIDGQIIVEARNLDFRRLAGMLRPKKRGATLARIDEATRRGWAGERTVRRPEP